MNKTRTPLQELAREACELARGDVAEVLELSDDGRLRIVGRHRSVRHLPMLPDGGHGPSAMVIGARRPLVSANVRRDHPAWAATPWNAFAALPVRAGSSPLGALVVFRGSVGDWSPDVIRRLEVLAGRAAEAMQATELIATLGGRIASLEQQVADLREEAHEHANRLHAVAGLLILEEPDAALSLLQELTTARLAVGAPHAWPHNVLAAMLHVEELLARHRDITLEVEQPDELSPTPLTDAQVVTIVGNLLDNARDAVADMPAERRKIVVRVSEDSSHLTVTVRDWGRGLPADTDWFERGVTTRAEHGGFGLALVRESVIAVDGEIMAIAHEDGAAFIVRVPLSRAADVIAPLSCYAEIGD